MSAKLRIIKEPHPQPLPALRATVYTQVVEFHLTLGFVLYLWAVGLLWEACHCEEERRSNRKNYGIMRLLRSARNDHLLDLESLKPLQIPLVCTP